MAETEELKQMVLNFRRTELVELLGFVGMNKVGVKATLLQRAMTLLSSSRGCSLPVQIKIRELYRQIHNPFESEPPRARTVASMRAQQAETDTRSRRYAANKSVSSSQLNSALAQQQALHGGAVDYTKRAADSLSTGSSSIPVHPDVTFKRLPFYDVMGELLKPTSLVPKGATRYQETYYVFHLTPQQAQDIAMSRDFRPTAKVEYTVQVQLRFCYLETSCEQDDNFPPSICVRVNGKVASLPNPIPTTKPGVEPKRPGRPVDITSLCRISPTMANHVEISWGSEYARCYCVSINLVKRLTSDVLLSRLKQFGNRHADHTRALIKDKLRHDPDCEIATTSLRVSLTCPLGKMRMQLPCRAATCTHLQCFDATTFLMMNEKKATWNCPVCDKPTPFHKLIIDGLFVEILRKVSDGNEIQFIEDGSWSPIRNNKETHLLSSPSVKSNAHEDTVNLCGDSTSDATSSPSKKPKMEVIDLTLSDSEDESEPTRPQSTQEISSGCVSPPVISIDSPGGPQSISSVSSIESPRCVSSRSPGTTNSISSGSLFESPKRISSRSNSSFSPLSSSSSSSSSNGTIGYNFQSPSSSRSPPLQSPGSSPRSYLSPRSPYKSPLMSPISPVPSPHPLSPMVSSSPSFLPPFPTLPPGLSLGPAASLYSHSSGPMPGTSAEVDREIEDFLNGLYHEYR